MLGIGCFCLLQSSRPLLTLHLLSNREDDSKWPQKNKDGRQELEIRLGNEHISFEVRAPSSHAFESLSSFGC